MRKRTARALVALTILATVTGATVASSGSTTDDRRAPALRDEVSAPTITDPWRGYEVAVAHVEAEEARVLLALADAAGQVAAYVAAVQADEYAAAVPPVAERPDAPSATPTAGGATGECGGATNGADAYIGRESGGNASVWNTGGSGAWGCYQIMPGTWSSSCSDLGAHGSAPADVQAQCASRLPLSAWGG